MPPEHRSAVIVDPHPLWLEALHALVERIDVAVVGTTTSAREALRLVEEHRPQVLVAGVDGVEEDGDGLALVEQARALVPALKPIVLSMVEDLAHVQAAFAAGAVAYVSRTAHPDDIAAAIRQAFTHTVYLADAVRIVQAPTAADNGSAGDLTRRELEVLRLVSEGKSNADVARSLWVTEQTVKFHLSNVYRKLDVGNRTEASRWAQVHGLLDLPGRGLDASDD